MSSSSSSISSSVSPSPSAEAEKWWLDLVARARRRSRLRSVWRRISASTSYARWAKASSILQQFSRNASVAIESLSPEAAPKRRSDSHDSVR